MGARALVERPYVTSVRRWPNNTCPDTLPVPDLNSLIRLLGLFDSSSELRFAVATALETLVQLLR